MIDDLRQALLEMVTRGIKPAAIIMTPPQMKRFMLACSPQDQIYFEKGTEGSGWKFEGLPIWRSWHLTGPCVVDLHLLCVLKRESYTFSRVGEPRYSEPCLF